MELMLSGDGDKVVEVNPHLDGDGRGTRWGRDQLPLRSVSELYLYISTYSCLAYLPTQAVHCLALQAVC